MLYKSLLEEYRRYIKENKEEQWEQFSNTIRKTVLTSVFGNIESNIIEQMSQKGITLSNDVKNIIQSMIDKVKGKLPYLVFYGKSSFNDQNVIIIYLLTKNNSSINRKSQIFDVLSQVPELKFNSMESKEKFVSLLIKGEVELELNGENHKIPLSNIGISFKKGKRKIKISSISRYYYDEKSNTYIIVNSKFIKDVIRELQVKGYTGNSVNLEQDFQAQLYFTYNLRNNDYDFIFEDNGIRITKNSLIDFMNDIIKQNISNIKVVKLKNQINFDKFISIIKEHLNELSNDDVDDEVVLRYDSENDELIQNLFVQLNLWKKIILDKINNGEVYISSENIVSDIGQIIKRQIKRNTKKEYIIINSIIDQINGNDKTLKELLDSIQLDDVKLSRKHKLYFLLLSLDKNQISSGDLYIILPNQNDDLKDLDKYIIIDNDTIIVNNYFNEKTLPYSYIIPVSYKKLQGQRYGKFSFDEPQDNMINNTIDEITENLLKQFTTISNQTFKMFKQYLVNIFNDINKQQINKKMSINEFTKMLQNIIQSKLKTTENKHDNIVISFFNKLVKKELTFDEDIMNTIQDDIKNSLSKDEVDMNNILKWLYTLINYLLYLSFHVQKLSNYIQVETDITEKLVYDEQIDLKQSLMEVKNINKLTKRLNDLISLLENTMIEKEKILSEIQSLQVKIFNQIVQTMYQIIYTSIMENNIKGVLLYIEMVNRQLKLNVTITKLGKTIIFNNSYFITSNLENAKELPYLLKGEILNTYNVDSKNEFIVVVYNHLKVLSFFKFYLKMTNENNFLLKIEENKINELQNFVDDIQKRIINIIVREFEDQKDDIINILKEINRTITITVEGIFDIQVSNGISFDTNIISFTFQFRSFGSQITSEQVDVELQTVKIEN